MSALASEAVEDLVAAAAVPVPGHGDLEAFAAGGPSSDDKQMVSRPAPRQKMMTCPKCGKVQTLDEHCRNCGIMISKYDPERESRLPPERPVEMPDQQVDGFREAAKRFGADLDGSAGPLETASGGPVRSRSLFERLGGRVFATAASAVLSVALGLLWFTFAPDCGGPAVTDSGVVELRSMPATMWDGGVAFTLAVESNFEFTLTSQVETGVWSEDWESWVSSEELPVLHIDQQIPEGGSSYVFSAPDTLWWSSEITGIDHEAVPDEAEATLTLTMDSEVIAERTLTKPDFEYGAGALSLELYAGDLD